MSMPPPASGNVLLLSLLKRVGSHGIKNHRYFGNFVKEFGLKTYKDSDVVNTLGLPKLPFPVSSSQPANLSFDLHPLYASILQNGVVVKKGEVLGLDGDLRRVMVAPFTGVVRLLVTGTGPERRVKVFLSEQTLSSGSSRRN